MIRFSQILICLQIVALTLNAHADYLVRAPSVTSIEYQALLVQYDLKPLTDLGSPVTANAEQRHQLAQQLEKAQRAFLSESLEAAADEFRKITASALDYDWDEASRDALSYSFFRLAQMSLKETERKQLIRQGLSFRREGSLNQDMFPPPFLSLVKEERSHLEHEAVNWEPSLAFRGYSTILVNGTSYDIKEGIKLRIWPGTYRITALSNMHLPFSQVIKSEDLADVRLNRAPLAQGDCENPKLSQSPKRSDFVFAFDANCLKTYRNESWMSLQSQAEHSTEAPQLNLPLVKEAPNLLQTSQAKEPERRWYQNKWVWIGAAVLATSVTLMITQNQKNAGSSAGSSSSSLAPAHKGPLPPEP